MSLYVREWGPANAPTIVLLHGGGVGSWMWEPQRSLLAQYHCLAPDLPEHGGSMAAGPFSIANSAQRVAQLILAKAHGRKAHVVGLSLGAQVAVALLGESPALVQTAILSGTLTKRLPGAGLIRLTTSLYMPFRNIPALVRANMQSQGIPEAYYEAFREDTRAATAGSLGRILRENMSFKLPSQFTRQCGTILTPTLVVIGEKEQAVMRQSAQALLGALPNARGAVVERAGHNWPLQFPELFGQVVDAWIAHKPLPGQVTSIR